MANRFRSLVGVCLVGALLIPVTASAGGSAPAIAFDVQLGSPCVDGYAPRNTRLTISVRTAGGQERGSGVVTSDQSGQWDECFISMLTGVHGGDIVSAHSATASRSWRIPSVTMFSDRSNDRIWGMATPGRDLQLTVSASLPLAFLPGLPLVDTHVTAANDGSYSLDLSGQVDLLGAERIQGELKHGADTLYLAGMVPFVMIERGQDLLLGATDPGSSIQLELRDSAGHRRSRASGTTLVLGIFELTLQSSSGGAVYPRAGDRLVANLAGGVNLRVPRMALHGDAPSDVVTGHCMANAPYVLQVTTDFFGSGGGDFVDALFYGTTHADGTLRRNVSAQVNLKGGLDLSLYCRYPSGDLLLVTASVAPPVH